MIIYKAISKTELAQDAGVSMFKLRQWLKEYEDILNTLGVNKKAKILTPAAVAFIANKKQIMPRNAIITQN